MRKRVFAVHVTAGANSYTGQPEAIFWRGYRDGTTAGSHSYAVTARAAAFALRLVDFHDANPVHNHPAYGGELLYTTINIRGRYDADWSFDSLSPSTEEKPPPVDMAYGADEEWPDEWD